MFPLYNCTTYFLCIVVQHFFSVQLYDMDKAKVDFDERMKKGTAIKAEIDKTLAAVNEANATLQVRLFVGAQCVPYTKKHNELVHLL